MSTKVKPTASSQAQGQPQPQPQQEDTTKLPQMTTTGELARTTKSNTNTDPLLKEDDDYKRYQSDVRTIMEMQVPDIMAFQEQHGYIPRRGDTSIEKYGLNPEDQEAVLRGEKRLEIIDKEKGTYRAEAIQPAKK